MHHAARAAEHATRRNVSKCMAAPIDYANSADQDPFLGRDVTACADSRYMGIQRGPRCSTYQLSHRTANVLRARRQGAQLRCLAQARFPASKEPLFGPGFPSVKGCYHLPRIRVCAPHLRSSPRSDLTCYIDFWPTAHKLNSLFLK